MLFNTNTNGDPRSFMYYKGEYYINGTEFTLNDEYLKNKTFHDKKLWKYARFSHQINSAGKVMYFFDAAKIDSGSLYMMGLDANTRANYAPYFVISPVELDYAIGEFTKPIKLSKEGRERLEGAVQYMIDHPKRDWDYPELIWLWLIYIAVLVGSLIFYEFYIVWAVATIVFCTLRKGILKQ